MPAYLAMRLGMALVGVLPHRVAVALGELAGGLFSRFATGRRRMAERHARRLGVAESEISTHVQSMFASYGRYWAEALWMRPRRRAYVDAMITHEGIHHVEAAKEAGRGIVFGLPHMGNWEYAAPIAGMAGIEVVAVAENLANRRIRDWFVRLRHLMGIQIVLATGAAQVMRELEEMIAKNGAVALLCDRDIRGRGVQVEFFGERTTIPAGPASLAIRTGAALIPVATYFNGAGHHVVIRPPLDLPETGDRPIRIRQTTQMLARELEVLIKAAPDQWHLLQPNWPSDRSARE